MFAQPKMNCPLDPFDDEAYLDATYGDWYGDPQSAIEDMVRSDDMRGINAITCLIAPIVNWRRMRDHAISDAMYEFITTMMYDTPSILDDVPDINTMEHPEGGVEDFEQVYDEDFDDYAETPNITSLELGGQYEYRGLYPPTVAEQQMMGVRYRPIILGPQPPGYETDEEVDGPDFASEMLDPVEFPVRYPGMPGYQPMME